VLAPLLAQVFKLDRVWLRRGLMVAGIGLLPLATGPVASWLGNSYLGSFSLLGNLQYFLVGFLLADWQATARAPASRRWWWDLFFILAGVVVVVFRNSGWLGFALPAIIGVCAVAAFKGPLTFRALGNPWITTIGGMCYTIYMYHWLMISMLIRPAIHLQTHILWLDLLIYFVLMSAVIVAVCAVLFALFERPFMRRDWPVRVYGKLMGVPRNGTVASGSPTPP
jgi:peptidoglycan/LPS O-acetylase OafA/YrhL